MNTNANSSNFESGNYAQSQDVVSLGREVVDGNTGWLSNK